MQIRMRAPKAVSFLMFVSLLLPAPMVAQQSPSIPPPLGPTNRVPEPNRDPVARKMENERLRQANKERQQKLRDDTDKLLQLANELKAEVDKTNENVLSLDVIKKTEQIEKLAKSVRERMKEEHVSLLQQ